MSGPSSVLPLHLLVLDRAPQLLDWVQEWTGEEVHVTKPTDWFYRVQQAPTVERNLALGTAVCTLA
jgi:hypothetical protein